MSESDSSYLTDGEDDDSQAIPIEELMEFCKTGGVNISVGNSKPKTKDAGPPRRKAPVQDFVDITPHYEPSTIIDSSSLTSELLPYTAATGTLVVNDNLEEQHETRRGKVYSPTAREKRKRNWKRATNSMKRMRGEPYLGFSTTKDPLTLRKKTHQIVARHGREIGPTCSTKYCRDRATRHCSIFTNEQRYDLYSAFWSHMDWSEKRAHVRSLVDHVEPTHLKKNTARRREQSFAYFLKHNGRKKQVCRKMFLNTLGLRKDQVTNWLKREKSVQPALQNLVKRNGGDHSFYKEFLTAIPKMPSHYCRQDTSKKYVEILFRTKMELYNAYKSECIKKGLQPTSVTTFYVYFAENNYALHRPKKDMCDTCSSYAAESLQQNEYDLHVAKKEAAREVKIKDKEIALEGKAHVVTMDVQKVLLSPMLNASALYYKTKLVVHNFTVYDLESHLATCFLFDETEADLGSSSFATCLISYFRKNYHDDLPIIVYSDGCTSQNRNGYLSSALLHYACKSNTVVMQKYLEKGHTQMECDTVHALIEKRLKGRPIYVPTDYVKICSEARSTPQPYEVQYMNHTDFDDYGRIKCDIRPGKKAKDPVVTDLRQLKYTPDGSIQYKLDHRDDWNSMPRKYRVDSKTSFPKLYKHRLPLQPRKFKDLQDLLHVIPECHHEFYKSLPVKSN